ncbi:hypothetical protein K501DRAFT_178950 [Backusella circina FSU 941]|nr:hypothetical protein K501DRAFT_178950 [Backusella circina FSU 941]
MQLAKKIDWEDPNVLTFARIGYFGAQLLVVGLSYGLIAFINKKNDTTVLTYENPAKPSLSGETSTPQTITTTIRDYDVDQMNQFIKSTLTSVVIISIMHFKFHFTQPLLMQSIMPIKNLLAHKEALIHLWGDAPEGNLARPFVADNPLSAITSMFGGGSTEVTAPASNEANSADNRSKKD